MSAEQQIRDGRLVAIVRLPRLSGESAAAITQILVDCGIGALEFTLNSEGALDAIRAARKVAGNRAAIGAGTVLRSAQVEQAADAGAQFVVSPDVSPGVIRRTVELGLTSLPGAFTASEVLRALDHGAHFVKLFPAQPAGPGYLRSLLGPLPEVPFVPTGGISLTDVSEFLRAGAVAVALGSSLVRSVNDLTGLRDRARQAVAAVSRA